jgi:uncharacterized protein YecE (DUF72 family)
MLQTEALEILKTGVNVFLTGEPGSGKTYVINKYLAYLREHNVSVAVTASTGIAATHIGGTTIHSFCGIGIHKYLNDYILDSIMIKERVVKKVRETSVLIIDEVSMMDAQMLDNVDMICKSIKNSTKPFGGMQVVFVGDFFQLPPVSRGEDMRFAFLAQSFQEAKPLPCYLSEQHRQSDESFLDLLVSIRQKTVTDTHYDLLDSRIKETKKILKESDAAMATYTQLHTHNKNADEINDAELEKIDEKTRVYKMKTMGKPALVESLLKSCLSPEELTLKVGARVMCVKSNPAEGYVNGTLATVTHMADTYVTVRTNEGRIIDIKEAEWVLEEDGKPLARLLQLPLRLAWAITVHKSQGMSLDAAHMDLGRTFEYGQGYVTLSRVRSLDGLYISSYNEMSLSVDETVFKFDMKLKESSKLVQQRFNTSEAGKLTKLQEEFIKKVSRARVEVTPKPDTYEETLKLLKSGLAIDKVSKKRDLKLQTILTHVEELVAVGKLTKEEVKRSIPKKYHKIGTDIKKAFKEHGYEKLAPVYHELDGNYTYEELSICRLLLV